MNVLAIDASSSAVGMAAGWNHKKATHMRLIVPPKDLEWNQRLAYMRPAIGQFIEDVQPDIIVLESLGGFIKHGGASTQKYGAAVGYVLCLCELYGDKLGFEVELVLPTTWTKGGSKTKRKAHVQFMFNDQGYANWSDGGGDLSDALMLMSWYHDKLISDSLKAQAK